MASIPCLCGGATSVVNSRLHRSGNGVTIRRMRRCCACHQKFETIEKHFSRPRTSKLTTQQVGAIRLLRGRGWSMPKLARRYGVSATTVWNILQGFQWSLPET